MTDALHRVLDVALVKAIGLVGRLVVVPFAVAGRRHPLAGYGR